MTRTPPSLRGAAQLAAALALLATAAAVAGVTALPSGWAWNAAWTAAALSALLGVVYGARAEPDAHHRRSWWLLAAACASWLVGQLHWNLYAVIGSPPSPNVADAGWYLFAPLAAIASARLAGPRRDDGRVAAIELAVLIVAVGGGVLALLLPSLEGAPSALAGRVAGAAYPVLYVSAAVIASQALLRGRIHPLARPGVLLVVAGIAIEAAAFILWVPIVVAGGVPDDAALNALWVAGLLAIGAGGLVARPARARAWEPMPTVLPGSAFVFVLAVLVFAALHDEPLVVRLALDLALFLVGGLLTMRAWLVGRAARLALRREQSALRSSRDAEEQLDRFFTVSLDLLCVSSLDGRFIRLNPAFERTLGWPLAELRDRPLLDLVHRDDRAAVAGHLDRLAGEGIAIDFEARLRCRDGSHRWLDWTAAPALERGLVYASARDMTDQKAAEADLARMAYTDPLTGLPNRTSFQSRLDAVLADARRDDREVAVLFIDLDNFKLVNDGFGHHFGDELLREVARRLIASTRPVDVVARQGGDEFLVLVPGASRPDAERLATRLHAELGRPFLINGTDVYTGASVGISFFPDDAQTSADLLKTADSAMYGVKRAGRNGFRVYRGETAGAPEQLRLTAALRRSVEEGSFVLAYQPLFDLETGAMSHVEALLRWRDAEHGRVSPEVFIPVAERAGLIGAVSDWVVREACRQARAWQDEGADVRVSVNLPPGYLLDTGARDLLAVIAAHRLSPDRLGIELTESALMDEAASLRPVLQELHDAGIRLAIDDFGTGHSSLARLGELPVDDLKIDRSFVTGLPGDERACTVATSIIRLAGNLGIVPVAEGIETPEQRAFLLRHGCRRGQGFLLSRPVAARDVPVIAAAGMRDAA